MVMLKLVVLFLAVYGSQGDSSYPTLSEVFSHEPSATSFTDIVLVGANGDLAKKYLWKGIFDLFLKYNDKASGQQRFRIFGAGTKNDSVGSVLLNGTLATSLKCAEDDFQCNSARAKFINQISYRQLKREDHYQTLCNSLKFTTEEGETCKSIESCSYQRIFYLSVPPFAYESVTSYLSTHCRPDKEEGILKVVLEKPFGHDMDSAVQMAASVSKSLHNSEVYRVDHYLGKQAVGEIISFRRSNPFIEKRLNSRNVEKIEIVMKEKIGVAGRTNFYDKYGVLCDVMQNHLSEILYLLTMDLPPSGASPMEMDDMRLSLIKQIQAIQPHDVLVGQYEGYQQEVKEDSGTNKTSKTPTFGATFLRINSVRWNGVPIIMTAGKQLNERIGYIRVVFKNNMVSPFSNSANVDCHLLQVVFHIGHGPLSTPAILVSKALPLHDSYVPKNWHGTDSFQDTYYLGTLGSCFKIFVPDVIRDAYSLLIEQLYLGRQEYFVTTGGLLESWKIWNNAVDVNRSRNLAIYEGQAGKNHLLKFEFNTDGLSYQATETLDPLNHTTHKFLGSTLISGSEKQVIEALAVSLQSLISETVFNDREFHLALSGGKTPLKLFQHLRLKHLPWEKVHIWQVDERCTPDKSQSNFEMISESLLDHIPFIRHKNIHPMPVRTGVRDYCSDGSDALYESVLKENLGELPQFDFVILGLGSDGHTASLFPHNKALNEKRLVTITENESLGSAKKRMTLTHPVLKHALRVAVLAMGKSKCEVIAKLSGNQCRSLPEGNVMADFPICEVVNNNKNMTWYLDNKALCL